MTASKKHLILILLAFFATYFVWGSTYLFVAFVVEEIPPFQMAAMRFAIATLIILVLSLIFTKNKKATKKQALNSMFAGFLFLTLGNGIMSWALQYLDSGFASLLVSAQPLVLLILLYFLEKTPISGRSILGVLLGIFGMYLLVSQNEINTRDNHWIAILAIFLCLLFWGYASIFVKKADVPKNHLINSGIQMGFASISLFLISLIIGEDIVSFSAVSQFNWFSLIYLALFGSVIAFTSFNFLLQHISPEKVSTSTYVNPLVALALGWYFRDELITTQAIIAAGILLSGVYFINTRKHQNSEN